MSVCLFGKVKCDQMSQSSGCFMNILEVNEALSMHRLKPGATLQCRSLQVSSCSRLKLDEPFTQFQLKAKSKEDTCFREQ